MARARIITLAGLLAIAGCVDEEFDEVEVAREALVLPTRLKPPEPYVLGDGNARLTLEQARILAPNGRAWALVLGKALFWDRRAGSDGNACASCHFSAGADPRVRNQLSPGFEDTSFPNGDTTFGSTRSDTGEVAAGHMPSGALAKANYALTAADFPLLKLVDKRDRNSPIRTDTNDAVSSQGSFDQVYRRTGLLGILLGAPDECVHGGDVFAVGRRAARQVEPRNTPTTINAAFFHSNFWDGRANNIFNGVGVFGPRDIAGDPDKRLVILDNGQLRLGSVEVRNASLASQAVGPPLSATEMSCDGRSFPDVARRMLYGVALADQKVDPTDSLLGPYANPYGKGLRFPYLYALLVMNTFPPEYWAAPGRYRIENGTLVPDPSGYTQMELNFSLFWGISIMLYEQTLISDQSRFDDWFASCRPAIANPDGNGSQLVPILDPTVTCRPVDPTASTNPLDYGFSPEEVLGFALFNNGGVGIRNAGNPACSSCHPITNPVANPIVFPLFTEAAFQEGQPFVPVERSLVVDPGFGLPAANEGGTHARGFFNLGLRPASVDLGNGGTDPYGNPLSVARTFLHEQAGATVTDPSGIANRCAPTPPGGQPLVELGGTPPYPGCANGAPVAPLDLALERQLVDGSFKTPSIRNVGLTPPYFHYGGYSDLRSVVEVYARGGSKRNHSGDGHTGDWSGTGRRGAGPTGNDHGTNVNFFIRDVRSTDEQIDALVAFMLTTTDDRVRCDQAPFDHPSLEVTHGHATSDRNFDGYADDLSFELPAVGAAGYKGSRARYCIPNKGDLFAPGMGSRRGE